MVFLPSALLTRDPGRRAARCPPAPTHAGPPCRAGPAVAAARRRRRLGAAARARAPCEPAPRACPSAGRRATAAGLPKRRRRAGRGRRPGAAGPGANPKRKAVPHEDAAAGIGALRTRGTRSGRASLADSRTRRELPQTHERPRRRPDRQRQLGWMLDDALKMPEARHAILLSADGLLMAHSAGHRPGRRRTAGRRRCPACSRSAAAPRSSAASPDTPWRQTLIEFDGRLRLPGRGRARAPTSRSPPREDVDMEAVTFRHAEAGRPARQGADQPAAPGRRTARDEPVPQTGPKRGARAAVRRHRRPRPSDAQHLRPGHAGDRRQRGRARRPEPGEAPGDGAVPGRRAVGRRGGRPPRACRSASPRSCSPTSWTAATSSPAPRSPRPQLPDDQILQEVLDGLRARL